LKYNLNLQVFLQNYHQFFFF